MPLSDKKKARREKFRKIGAAISAMADDRDYHTGLASKFQPRHSDKGNRDVDDPLNRDRRPRVEIPFGPRFKTLQWERTTRQK